MGVIFGEVMMKIVSIFIFIYTSCAARQRMLVIMALYFDGLLVLTWHQDNGYACIDPQHYLTCWVASTDATVETGCPWVLPYAHGSAHSPTAGMRRCVAGRRTA
jgi:ectoine hydroxylase-related dioxygenase (phytanoyl-CoA dioxygenase family)